MKNSVKRMHGVKKKWGDIIATGRATDEMLKNMPDNEKIWNVYGEIRACDDEYTNIRMGSLYNLTLLKAMGQGL